MLSKKNGPCLARWPGFFPQWWGWLIVVFGLIIFAGSAPAQTNADIPPPAALKKLTLDELMDMEVTSVSKRPEKLSETASAIQVITGEQIHRSGASSIPEALRLAG